MTTCDWCGMTAPQTDLFNVEYLNEDYSPNGYANVLCVYCLTTAHKIHGEEFVEAWN